MLIRVMDLAKRAFADAMDITTIGWIFCCCYCCGHHCEHWTLFTFSKLVSASKTCVNCEHFKWPLKHNSYHSLIRSFNSINMNMSIKHAYEFIIIFQRSISLGWIWLQNKKKLRIMLLLFVSDSTHEKTQKHLSTSFEVGFEFKR